MDSQQSTASTYQESTHKCTLHKSRKNSKFATPRRNHDTHNTSHQLSFSIFTALLLGIAQTLLLNSSQAFNLRDKPKSDQQTTNANSCPARYWVHDDQLCFRFHTKPKIYELAVKHCSSTDGHLSVVDDEAKHEQIIKLLSQYNLTLNKYFVTFTKFANHNSSFDYESEDGLNLEHILLPDSDPYYKNGQAAPRDLEQSNITYAYAFSSLSNRWGLIPVDKNKRNHFICERTANDVIKHDVNQDHSQPTRPATSERVASPTNSVEHSEQDKSKKKSHTPPSQAQDTTNSIFRELPQDQSVILDSSVEMRCSAIEADSNLNWTFEGKNLTRNGRIESFTNGTLRIKAVRNYDVGVYTCSITSSGLTESRSARLDIIELPHASDYIFAELLDKVSTSVRVKWTPGFNGNSPITKYTIEMKIVNSDRFDHEDSIAGQSTNSWAVAKTNISSDQTSVIIPDLKPARKYIFRVIASNKVGTGSPSNPTKEPIEIPVQPPSLPPEKLTGTARSSSSITVQWQPPPQDSQNGMIRGYKIHHRLAGYGDYSDSRWHTTDVKDPTLLTYNLEDLIDWKEYDIQIAAENDRGVGPFGPTIRIRTKEGKPDKSPKNVAAEALNSKSVVVSWDPPPPQHLNGINQGYKVQFFYDDASHMNLAKSVTVPPNLIPSTRHNTTVTDLQPYTKYFISVLCFTSAGNGPSSDINLFVTTKEDFPEAVTSLEFADVFDKSLKLIWKPPVHSNGELISYNLDYIDTITGNRIVKTYPPSVTEAKIIELEPQTTYSFKLCAQTSVGQGPTKSASVATTKPPVLPEPPTDIICTHIGPTNVTIQFNSGFDGNSNIDRWIVEAQRPNKGDQWNEIYVSTNHTKANYLVVQNLRPYTRYRLRLIPMNIVGASERASEPSPEFQTLQLEPEHPPFNFTITSESIQSTSVRADWIPLSKSMWRGNPRGYNLSWVNTYNSTTSFIMINDTEAHSFFVGELEEFTEYVFRIFAINEVGSSASADSIHVTTSEDTPSAGPTNVSASAISSTAISVSWQQVPYIHRNGIIRGYKIQYQSSKHKSPLLYKVIADNTTRHTIVNDLKPYSDYHFAILAYTSAGDGVSSEVVLAKTFEDTPSLPTNLSFPSVSQTSARILWDPPEDANGEILGYKVSYHPLSDGPKESNSHELSPSNRTFRATNLKTDTHYVFTVTAKTKEGWGQQSNMLVYTTDSELRANLPFFRESWFVILCFCLSVIITIIITAILYVRGKSYKYKQDALKTNSHDRLGETGLTLDDELANPYQNGFGLMTQNSINSKRRNGSVNSDNEINSTMPKLTPKSMHNNYNGYNSDEGDDDVFENVVDRGLRNTGGPSGNAYDSSDTSLPEKQGEMSSSTGPETPEDEYVNMASRQQLFDNHYANVNNSMRKQRNGSVNYAYGSQSTKLRVPQKLVPTTPDGLHPGQDVYFQSTSSNSGISQSNHRVQNNMNSTIQQNSNNSYATSSVGLMYNQDSQRNDIIPNYPSKVSQDEFRDHQVRDNFSESTNILQSLDAPDGSIPISHISQNGDLLHGQAINLNGGRIIVDNMAGSRAPLPGFTSFV